MEFPYNSEVLSSQESQELIYHFKGSTQEFVRIGPKKFFFKKDFLLEAASIYNFTLRHDDTFVVTYPKSGTTLTQELVWLICNNLDYEKAQSIVLNRRYVFLELPAIILGQHTYSEEQINVLEKTFLPMPIKEVDEMLSPRFIKSHMPMSLLPPSLLDKTKVVYVARDPRDVAVSYYHHENLMKTSEPVKQFKQYWNNFISDNVTYGPYFAHVLEAWEKRNHPNMLFLFYEEITQDLPRAVERVAIFFGKTLSEEQINKLACHLGFDKFKKNTSVNLGDLQQTGIFTSAFIRRGKSGGWRDYFDEEMTAQADEWIAKHLRDTDFRLPHF